LTSKDKGKGGSEQKIIEKEEGVAGGTQIVQGSGKEPFSPGHDWLASNQQKSDTRRRLAEKKKEITGQRKVKKTTYPRPKNGSVLKDGRGTTTRDELSQACDQTPTWGGGEGRGAEGVGGETKFKTSSLGRRETTEKKV